MSINNDEINPVAPPPPASCPHQMNDDTAPLLYDDHHHHHHAHHHQPSTTHAQHRETLMEVDLEAGSKSRARTLAILGMVAVLVVGVLRRYPYASGAVAATIILVFCLLSAMLSFLLFIAALLGILYNASDQAVYCPDYPPDARVSVMLPSTVGLPSENLRLYANDGTRLHAVFVGQPDSMIRRHAVTFLYFHGNAGNLGHRLANVCGLYNRLKCNLLLLEYRGFGFSSGTPSESGLYEDAAAALSYLHTRQDIDTTKVVVFGRSLGGAVGIDLASRCDARHNIRALILENTFTSIPDMAKALLPRNKFITSLPLCCYKNKFLSRSKMIRVQVPTLMVSGLRDTLVPPHMCLQLYQSCVARHKRLLRFAHGTHNETWRCLGYYHALKYFLDELLCTTTVVPPNFPPGVAWIRDASQIL